MPPLPRAGVDQAPNRRRGYARRAGMPCRAGPRPSPDPRGGLPVLPRSARLSETVLDRLHFAEVAASRPPRPRHLPDLVSIKGGDAAASPSWCRSRVGMPPPPRAGADQGRGYGHFPELVSIKRPAGSADARGGEDSLSGRPRSVFTHLPAILHLRPSQSGADPAWPGQQVQDRRSGQAGARVGRVRPGAPGKGDRASGAGGVAGVTGCRPGASAPRSGWSGRSAACSS